MDIVYSTGLKLHLIKSFQDADGKRHSGWRIWGFRVAQMVINLISSVAVASVVANVYHEKHNLQFKMRHKVKHNVILWLCMMSFLTLLSISGVLLFVYAKYIKTRFVWVVTTGIYNLVHSLVIFYAMVLGSTVIFTDISSDGIIRNPKPIWAPPTSVIWHTFASGIICLIASIIHFVSAFYPTPFPPTLRLQRVAPESKDDEKKYLISEKESGAIVDNDIGGESGTTTVTDGGTMSDLPSINPSQTQLKEEGKTYGTMLKLKSN